MAQSDRDLFTVIVSIILLLFVAFLYVNLENITEMTQDNDPNCNSTYGCDSSGYGNEIGADMKNDLQCAKRCIELGYEHASSEYGLLHRDCYCKTERGIEKLW